MNKSELLKKIRTEKYNISRRMKRIEKNPEYAESSVALRKFKEIESKLSDLANKDETYLLKIDRQLRYIDSLKTSRIKGIQETNKTLRPIMDILKKEPPENRQAFWDAYANFYEYTGGLAENFKYQVWETLTEFLDEHKYVDLGTIINESFLSTVLDDGEGEYDELY